ncbi:35671_t:CDS:2, partial [Racocetra persica]
PTKPPAPSPSQPTKPPTPSQPTSTALTIISPPINVPVNVTETKETKEISQPSNSADANDGTTAAATSPTSKQVAMSVPPTTAVTPNVPKEKPPVKLQRNRVPLTMPQSPKITPVQTVVSTPPPLEEQPTVRTSAISESQSDETSVVEPSETEIAMQPTSTEAASIPTETTGRKRSREDSFEETTSTGNETTEMQDVQISDNTNPNVEVAPQSPASKNEETTVIAESVANNQIDTNESEQPSSKRVKVEDSNSDI